MFLLHSESLIAVRQEAKVKFDNVKSQLTDVGKCLIKKTTNEFNSETFSTLIKPYPFSEQSIYTDTTGRNWDDAARLFADAFTNKGENITLDCLDYFLTICNNAQNLCFKPPIAPYLPTSLYSSFNHSIASDGYYFFLSRVGCHINECMNTYYSGEGRRNNKIKVDFADFPQEINDYYMNQNQIYSFRKWIIPIPHLIKWGDDKEKILIILAVVDFGSSTISFFTPVGNFNEGESIQFSHYFSKLTHWLSALMKVKKIEFDRQQWSFFNNDMHLSEETDTLNVVVTTCFVCYHILFNMPLKFEVHKVELYSFVAGLVLPLPKIPNDV